MPEIRVPDDLREAAASFHRAFDRLCGSPLPNDTFADLAVMRRATAPRVRTLHAGLTPKHFWNLLGNALAAAPDDERAQLCHAYLAAYGTLYPDDAHLALIREAAERPGAPAERPGAVALLERVTEEAIRDANRLIGTGAAAPSLEDLYVGRRFTGSRDVHTEEDLDARCDTMSVTVIVGEPGTGKTSALWRLARRRRGHGRTAWLIPAGTVEAEVPVADIAWGLRDRAAKGDRPVLLIDTVDLLLIAEELPPALEELIQECSAAGAALVMTCRPLEYKVLHHATRDRYSIDRLDLGPYGEADLPAAVRTHAEHFIDALRFDPAAITRAVLTAVARGLPIAQICRVPLTLRMLFELHELEHPGDEPLETEIDVTDLFDKYWNLRVRADKRTGARAAGPDADLTAAAEWLAVVMLAEGRPRLGYASAARVLQRVHGLLDDLDALVRRSVVHHVGDDRREFFHQTFFEYAVARALVTLGPDALGRLVARTIAHPGDAFLSAVTQQTLVYACRTPLDAEAADAAFAELLGCGHAGVRQVAVAAYAQARYRGERTAGAGRRLLAGGGPQLARRYLLFVSRVRHAELGPVLDDLTLIWGYDSADARAEVFGALHALAVVQRDAVYDVMSAEDCQYLTWYLGLDATGAQKRRRPVLDLLGDLAPEDPAWCVERLEEVARTAARNGAQDGLAAVLDVAAESRFQAHLLRRILAVIPGAVKNDPSGANELGLVTSGIVRQIWAEERPDPVTVAADLAAGRSEPASLGPGHGWSPPDWLARPSRLRALAELTCAEPPDVADRVIDTLLTSADPMTRTYVGSYFLKHLLDGEDRCRLPGGAEPAETPATKAARDRCVRALRALAPSSRKSRSEPTLWREALYRSQRAPADVAAIVRDATRGEPDPGWLDPDRLAALVAPAAIGGLPAAQAALRRWCERRANAPADKRVSSMVMARIEHLAADYPQAFDYLIADALTTSDGSYVDGALTKLEHRARPLPDGFADRVAPLLTRLLAARTPATRRHGFAIAARVGHGRPVQPHTLRDGLRIRDTGALTAVLNVVAASLEHDTDRWRDPGAYTDLDNALATLATPGAAPQEHLGRRAYEYRAMLPCHHGPITTPADRATTLRRVRELVLDAEDPALLEPLGRLLSRLAPVDPGAAADLLVDTAAAVERIEVPGQTDAWKAHKVFRLRHAIRNVMVALPYGDWKRAVDALARHDLRVFTTAIEVSVRERPEDAATHIRRLIATLHLTDDRAEAILRAADTRRQRITGGISTWPDLLTLWQAKMA
ncbi:NACHT domain-containing protein [Dactylosporangium sp. NPDC051541]|uniref:NACHT domain-containing protein n=1 Tax=Dactylosporangium sp. NPDC051541 TaxID=3363977 RepID=UPI0037AE26F5